MSGGGGGGVRAKGAHRPARLCEPASLPHLLRASSPHSRLPPTLLLSSVRFNIEGERGRKATAWAEVRSGTYDFRYLIVLAKDRSRVWSVLDARRAPPTEDERQARLSGVLAGAGWAFYADSEKDQRQQAAALGEGYFSKVKQIRCDEAPGACEAAGVLTRPAWTSHKTGEVLKGVLALKELEELSKEVAHKKKAWYQFW